MPYQHTQNHANARRAMMAERQVHKRMRLQGYTAVLTRTQGHPLYIYHTAAPTPQVYTSMPSLDRYLTAVQKHLLGISYDMTSDDRASSAQERMPSGRQSRNEYIYIYIYMHKSISLQVGRAGTSIYTILLFQHDKYTRACERATSNTTSAQGHSLRATEHPRRVFRDSNNPATGNTLSAQEHMP